MVSSSLSWRCYNGGVSGADLWGVRVPQSARSPQGESGAQQASQGFHLVPWSRHRHEWQALTSGGHSLLRRFAWWIWIYVSNLFVSIGSPFGEASTKITVSVEFREVLTLQKNEVHIHTTHTQHTHKPFYLCKCNMIISITLLPCLGNVSKTLKLKRCLSIS